ncbi:class I SAM-dependent methyltransferase [Halobacterium jilantaiense]|uniref:Methyltransferase domain-containing protein n=1 Tax=Halobacterium jilantaiense TaxID=355548 RepID=A0A1I0QRN6_9EURY|nr:class I SAM-dependent methyltransferase [Halobacterium jilantaiense]SEW30008.1 Methyltransferase domain-containing protein [Halobacterium jilantaiense]
MPPEETPTVEAAYDRLAATYERQEDDPYCADFEFPAMTDLVPDVAGKRVLDAGCGHGRYAEWLADRGADVVAVDENAEMLDRAERRVGDRVALHRADITEPLAFADDGEFDGVVCGLSLHYVEDWREPFAEFARILAPGGFLAFSAQHPVDEYVAFEAEDYFAVERETMTWPAADGEVDVPFYRRPFAEAVNPLLETGFQLDELVEPTPSPTFEDEKPESYEKRLRYPTFLCIRASLSE